jgi:hypothetical protein
VRFVEAPEEVLPVEGHADAHCHPFIPSKQLILYDSSERLAAVHSSLSAAKEAGLDSTKARFFTAQEAKEKFGVKSEGAVMVPGNNLYPLKLFVSSPSCLTY